MISSLVNYASRSNNSEGVVKKEEMIAYLPEEIAMYCITLPEIIRLDLMKEGGDPIRN
jgi:hypothetical protein